MPRLGPMLVVAGLLVSICCGAVTKKSSRSSIPGAPACPIFPATNVWNQDVSKLPVAANSATLIATIGGARRLHPDFGAHADNGIPFNVVGSGQRKVTMSFDYAAESDRGPYPLPIHPLIEAGSDAHLLIVDRNSCRLYELFSAHRTATGWHAGSGATWDLRSNALRPDGWTSADAAGLAILPGLTRYDEVAQGRIDHALRFTAPRTRQSHLYPARHDAGDGAEPNLPPMGLRVRLKASTDISSFPPQARVILIALKKYGLLLADNGSPWFVSGAPDPHWNDDDLHTLQRIKGTDLEVVDTRALRNGH